MHGNAQERFKKAVTKERVGNSYHTDPDSVNEFPHRHRNADKEVEINSGNFEPRKTNDGSGLYGEPQTAGDQAPDQPKGGIYPFKTASDNASNYTQRSRVPRQEVKDAEIKSLSDKRFKNEKDQRKGATLGKDLMNPRGQR